MLPTPSEHRRPTPFTQDRRQLAEARQREEAAQRRLRDNEEEGQALRQNVYAIKNVVDEKVHKEAPRSPHSHPHHNHTTPAPLPPHSRPTLAPLPPHSPTTPTPHPPHEKVWDEIMATADTLAPASHCPCLSLPLSPCPCPPAPVPLPLPPWPLSHCPCPCPPFLSP